MTAELEMVHLEHAMGLHYTRVVSNKVHHTGNFSIVPSEWTACVVDSNDHVPLEMEGGSYREELCCRWAFIRQKRATKDKLMEEAHSQFLTAVRECKTTQRAHSEDLEGNGEVTLKKIVVEE